MLLLKLLPHLPGANELIDLWQVIFGPRKTSNSHPISKQSLCHRSHVDRCRMILATDYQLNIIRCVEYIASEMTQSLQWHHNERDGVWNHQRLDCLLNRLFRRRSRNIKVPRHWPFWREFTGDRSPHKGPVTWKMFPFDDVIMVTLWFVRFSINIYYRSRETRAIVLPISFMVALLALWQLYGNEGNPGYFP